MYSPRVCVLMLGSHYIWTGGHEANFDEMQTLYIHLKQASLSPIGERKPSTKKDFRASFIRRCKNTTVNDKLHLIRTLNSTLKVYADPSKIVINSNIQRDFLVSLTTNL